MKRIHTARELYNEILKSFYFGAYEKDDRFMTYHETQNVYGLSKDTVARGYTMLRRDGFICTDGTNGTIVTFDVNNPKHVEKVPLEWASNEAEDTIPYKIAMRLHAHALYTGLTRSSETQLNECKELVREILRRIKAGSPCHAQVFALWMCVISSLENEFMNRITDHFISRYIYLLPPSYLSTKQQRMIRESAGKYYEFLLCAIEHRDFEEFSSRFEQNYLNYYRYGAVAFYKLEDEAVFKEQTLYGRLLDDFCIKIMTRDLRKGDTLPTTKQLCAEYGVSTTTVNRTYGILADLGLISRHVRSGTTLIAGPDDPGIWETLEEYAGFYKRDWRDAIEAILILSGGLNRHMVISSNIVAQMRVELTRQYQFFTRYKTYFFVSAVFLSPLIDSLPVGIVHQYYAQLTDTLGKVVALCTLRNHGNVEHGEEIYQRMNEALTMLERGDQSSFAILTERTLLRNIELITEDYTGVPRCSK